MNITVDFTAYGHNYVADIEDAAVGHVSFSKENALRVRIRKSTVIDICHRNGKNPKNWEHYDVIDFDNFSIKDSEIPGCLTLTITNVTYCTFR